MTQKYYDAPFEMPVIQEPEIPERVFQQVRGRSIQSTLDECAAAGGGTVTIPAGEWHTGRLHLCSHTRLHLEQGATLIFSAVPEDYLPPVFTRWEGMECYNYSPLIYANGGTDIAITGHGRLIGNGQHWWDWKARQQAAANELCYAQANGIPPEKRIYATRQAALRPSFVQPINCKHVLIEGITVEDGPQWTLHPVYCEDVIIRGVTVRTAGHNTDGLNPDSCRNVLIEHCSFSTGDDCIAVNAGMNEDGWRVGKPCENVLIRHCNMVGGHGAVVIGSAVSGGVRNVYAHDCRVMETMQGIRLKSMRGRGGTVENITFERFRIDRVTNEAIQVNMFYEFSTVVPKSNTPSVFRHITIRDVSGQGNAEGIVLRGLPEQPLEDVSLENITLTAKKQMTCENVTDLRLEKVSMKSEA